ncbi:MAG: asparagine synthase (glutamine-hydrolyzing) [Chloroflexi bacterium]|nr:asparagine synthase (glutamine-hydrolyzing) [Chloroflexota bacterium]
MCGIAGIYQFNNNLVSAHVLEQMTTRLAHRGPDDFGYVLFDQQRQAHPWKLETAPNVSATVGLGNRRLKIIDLSPAGHQPMANLDQSVWITFNGEIYNYRELRAELISKGYAFNSHSDTEVILNAYREWGTQCFNRLNGMWALAIYDARDGTLVLARDRWGVKPLFVHRTPDLLIFGSEIKTLLDHLDVPRQPNYRTIYNYVARHYRLVDGGRNTFFDGIENLLPAHYWKITPDGRINDDCYWSLDPNRQDSYASDEQVLENFRSLFEDAVRLRLRSDVPVACMLSGGLDSSSVTCVAAKIAGVPVTTFTARYAEREFDEGEYVQATVKHIGADGRFIYPQAGNLLDTLETMLSFHDEPVCTVTWFAHWMVMREVAGQGFPVLLNGHAGDELFAGYWDHYWYNFADLEQSDPTRFRYEYARWLANHERNPEEYSRLKTRLAALERGEVIEANQFSYYPDIVTADFGAQYQSEPSRVDLFGNRGHLSSRLYKEIAYETVPATLRPEDRNSMAFSIETRSPFLDYRLAEFAFALPNHFKIRNGLGKWIIRESMKGVLPETVRTRMDKQGFNAPTVHWFRAASGTAVREILASQTLAQRGILDQAQVLRCFDEHVAGQANHYMGIWQWVNLELWMRMMFDSKPATF